MPPKKNKRSYTSLMMMLVVLALIVFAAAFWFIIKSKHTPDVPKSHQKIILPEKKPKQVIDYHQLEKDTETRTMMQERKAEYGVDQGIDMIAKPDESLKVGDTTVPMQDILDEIGLKKGEIIEKNINVDETAHLPQKAYGIYVVQPGDNIWNIHFQFLQDYFSRRGVSLSPSSDEPDFQGFSSGIGKVLKFSENMVHIYNIKEKKLDINLNMILPLNKIVIYNMDQVFALLEQIDTANVNRIQFDGETLWIPAEQ